MKKRGELVRECAHRFAECDGARWLHCTNDEMQSALETGIIPEIVRNHNSDANDPDNGANGGLAAIIANAVSSYLPPQPPVMTEDRIREIVAEAMAAQPNRKLDITVNAGAPVRLDGLTHTQLPALLRLIAMRQPTYLVGPAGSGKSTAVHQAAIACGLKYYTLSIGPQTSKTDLLGYMDAGGIYRRPALREAFEHGGVMLLDEIDAGNPGVVTVINAMTANGSSGWPDGVVNRHADFVCVAAGNTYGRGADRLYVGRMQLDAATLDRLAVLNWDYDTVLERALTGNDDWHSQVMTWRENAANHKLRVIISPRASINGAAALRAGFAQAEVESMFVFRGISAEIERQIRGENA